MRLSVRAKLFGSFGVVTSLVVGLGVAAIVELGSVDNRGAVPGDEQRTGRTDGRDGGGQLSPRPDRPRRRQVCPPAETHQPVSQFQL